MAASESEFSRANDLQISTASESAKRASLLPTKGSDNASSVLGEISIPPGNQVAKIEYLPNTNLEWIVQATLGAPQKAKDVASRFGSDWRTKYGGLIIYGRDIATGHWTFLQSADGPEEINALQFAWTYYDSGSKSPKLDPVALYEARLLAVQHELTQLVTATVHSDVSAEDAYKRAQYLSGLVERFDRSIVVRRAAPAGKRFPGRDVWDVMLSLVLSWGNMDCFHWENRSNYGDDSFFSVWTSTEPGYFLPEEVAANRVNVADLVFGYSIPRSADPVTVFERMLRGVQYAQKRLGGTITTADGKPLTPDATSKEIKIIAEELDQLGYHPGSDNALRQF